MPTATRRARQRLSTTPPFSVIAAAHRRPDTAAPALDVGAMTPLLSQRSALAMLASLGLALAFGLLAAGPIIIGDAAITHADQRMLLGLPQLVNVLSCLPLAWVAAWGAMGVQRCVIWPAALRRPLMGFFSLSLAWSLLAALHHAAPTLAGAVAIHVLVAASAALLLLAFLTERHGLEFGSRRACAGAVALSALAGAAWWASGGDARALIWLQALPAMLVLGGLVLQPTLFTRRADWLGVLVLYLLARALEMADAQVYAVFAGWISGHALMHLAGAGLAAVLARRAWRAASGHVQSAPLSMMSSRRATSLHTAG